MTDVSADAGKSSASSRRVYLHVGAPKTGTTFLQSMLAANRARLLEDGCFYPLTQGASAHHVEARDLRNAKPRRGFVHPAGPGSWDRLARTVREWDGEGIALLSSELLVFATRDKVERALQSLQPAEVHLVVTVRDLVRQIPAVWQETVKNGNTTSYEDYLRELVEDEDGSGPRGVWNGQDPVRILARWGYLLPPERIHLVTVPPAGNDPRLLWTRFASVLGVDPEDYPLVPKGANTSLGVAETEVVRRLNVQLRQAPWQFYSRHVKVGLAQGVLAGRSEGARLVLPDELLPMVERRTKRIIDTISGAGYDVVGDLDDLLPPKDGAGTGPVAEPEPAHLAEASAAAAGYLAGAFARYWQRSQRSEQRTRPAAGQTEPRPAGLRTRLVRLSERHRAVDVLRRGYRLARRRVRR
ncbi:MAG TPA: hypothetical protein VHG70_13085 [Nocardioidaceae bacterium]|nr:hypothetical protein [Nocardioidaceae bacterium]